MVHLVKNKRPVSIIAAEVVNDFPRAIIITTGTQLLDGLRRKLRLCFDPMPVGSNGKVSTTWRASTSDEVEFIKATGQSCTPS